MAVSTHFKFGKQIDHKKYFCVSICFNNENATVYSPESFHKASGPKPWLLLTDVLDGYLDYKARTES